MNQAKEYYEKALISQKNQKLAEALRFLKKALSEDAFFKPALFLLGVIYSNLKEPKKAMEFFLRAYKIEKTAITCFNLGSESFKLGNFEESRHYLKECLHMDKNLVKGHLLLGYVYQKNRKYDKAAIYYQNALKLSPGNRMAMLGFSVSLSEQGHLEGALFAIEKYLSQTPDDLFAKQLRASLFLQLNHAEEAYHEYSNLIHTAPKFKKFNEYISELKNEADIEYKQSFDNIDDKINARVWRLKKRLAQGKIGHDLSAEKNGIEGSMDLSEDLRSNLKDMVDLSLLHLFKGDTDKALKYLFQARKWKVQDEKN